LVASFASSVATDRSPFELKLRCSMLFFYDGIGRQRPAHIPTTRRSDNLAIVVDQGAAQEGALHSTREFLPFERRISLF
jgi:hypothetical protein